MPIYSRSEFKLTESPMKRETNAFCMFHCFIVNGVLARILFQDIFGGGIYNPTLSNTFIHTEECSDIRIRHH